MVCTYTTRLGILSWEVDFASVCMCDVQMQLLYRNFSRCVKEFSEMLIICRKMLYLLGGQPSMAAY